MKYLTPFLICTLLLSLVSCRREKLDWNGPIPGRVVHVGSHTPVPHALVRFIQYGATAESWDIEVGQDTTDENGHFTIPASLSLDAVIAWGPSDLYTYPSEEISINRSGLSPVPVELTLTPPAWAWVRAEDVEPLNPEVYQVVINTKPGDFPLDQTPLNEPVLFKTLGNVPFELNYRLQIIGETTPWLKFTRGGLPEFDTTEVVITY